jgi:hypothetical protein
MKTISILLVSLLIIGCSVAGLLVASAQQSSPQIGSTLQTTEQQKAAWVARSNPGLHGAAVTCQTDEKHFMHVTKCNFGKHSPEEVINWMIDQNTERDTCGSRQGCFREARKEVKISLALLSIVCQSKPIPRVVRSTARYARTNARKSDISSLTHRPGDRVSNTQRHSSVYSCQPRSASKANLKESARMQPAASCAGY